VTAYDAPLPPNGWTKEDVQRLRELASPSVRIVSLSEKSDWPHVAWKHVKSGKENLCDQFDEAAGRGRKQAVIVYLSMHGLVNENNEPCLLPPQASPWDSKDWLPVGSLLDDLLAKHADRDVLLLLDCSRIDVDWSLGVLQNDFADRLRGVVKDKQRKYRGLSVLCSAGPGQLGWTAPELGGSVFGYYVWRGLQGKADNNRDRRVGLQELGDYVQENVSQWVRYHRNAAQEPMLIASGRDYPLVHAKPSEEHEEQTPALPHDPRWSDLETLWAAHGALAAQSPWRWHPLEWARFQRGLLRMEQLLQAGDEYRDRYNSTKQVVEDLAKALQRKGPIAAEAFSLPMAQRLGTWPSAQEMELLEEELKGQLSKQAGPQSKPEEAATAKADAAKAPGAKTDSTKADSAKTPAAKAEASQPPAPKPVVCGEAADYGRAEVAWNWFLQQGAHDQKLCDAMLKYVDGASPRPKDNVIEVHFLRMLSAYLDPTVWDKRPDQVVAAAGARDRAEKAAAPQDQRAAYWVRPLVDPADALRRQAEDKLFLGNPLELDEAREKLWPQAEEKYLEAIRRAGTVSEALELRDRAWAEIPYLTLWQLNRPTPSGSRESAAAMAHLIGLANTVTNAIDQSLKTGDWTLGTLTAVADLRRELADQEKTFHDECSDLTNAGPDTRTLQNILAALDCPLAGGDLRKSLRDRCPVIMRTVATSAGDAAAARRKGSKEYQKWLEEHRKWLKEHHEERLERLEAFQKHPALILDRPDAEKKTFARQNERVRWLLATVAGKVEEFRDAKPPAAGAGQPRDPRVAARCGLGQAERLVRAAAPLVESWSSDRNWQDPVEELRQFDLCHLLLWHADRAMDDFWGPAPGCGTASFFQVAAESYLGAARQWERAAAALDAESVKKTLDKRSQAARKAVEPEQPKDISVDAKEPRVELSFSLATAENLPPGEAAVYLKRLDGTPEPVATSTDASKANQRRMGLEATGAAGSRSLACWISNGGRLDEALKLRIVALYRGHVHTRQFTALPALGVEVVYKPPQYPNPTIVVRGDDKQTSAVMFILDCSGSMKNQLRGSERAPTRLQEARAKLLFILDRLAAFPLPYDVGLLVYGHRVGWNPNDRYDDHEYVNLPGVAEAKRKDDLKDSDKWRFWADKHPWNDVEVLRGVSPLHTKDIRGLETDLNALRPRGETPLYLAICQAARELDKLNAVAARDRDPQERRDLRIIAITDGANDQTEPDSFDERRDYYKGTSDVEKALQSNIRLDVVCFAFGERDLDPSDRASFDQFRQLEKKDEGENSRVKFYDAPQPTDLLKALVSSLQLSHYVVTPVKDGRSQMPEPRNLYDPWVIKQPSDAAVDYLVKLVDAGLPAQADVRLEGGEAIELYVEREAAGQRRLVHRRYEKDIRGPSYRDVQSPLDIGRTFFIAAHLPKREPDAVTFYVSIQNGDEKKFSRRPAEAWVEVRPLVGEESRSDPQRPNAPAQASRNAPVYVFYDACYLSERPVPVLSCRAIHWPPDAREAEIRLWCKMSPTRAAKEITVRKFRERPLRLGNVSFDIEVTGGATSADLCQVKIIETHPPDADLHTVKVEMSPQAGEVRHIYYPETKTGKVCHVFSYPETSATTVEGYTIRLTTVDALKEEAITPRPLKVPIPKF
jgi:hypothetical protein